MRKPTRQERNQTFERKNTDQPKKKLDLKEYKDLIETVAKVEYSKLSTAAHLVDYQELVNLNTHTLYILFKNR